MPRIDIERGPDTVDIDILREFGKKTIYPHLLYRIIKRKYREHYGKDIDDQTVNNRLKKMVASDLIEIVTNSTTGGKYYKLTDAGEKKLSKTLVIDCHTGPTTHPFVMKLHEPKYNSALTVYSVAKTTITFANQLTLSDIKGEFTVNNIEKFVDKNSEVSFSAKTAGKFVRFEVTGGEFRSSEGTS